MTAGIGERVARFRKRAADANGKQMTVQALADRCAELGLPLGRLTITKLERGNRQAVTPAEVMVLAVALEVPPVELIFPVGQSEDVEILPGRKVPPLDGLRWFSGELALDVTEAALTARAPRVGEESAGLLLEEHEAVTGRLAQMEADAAQAADIARREPGDSGRQEEASYRVVAAEYFRDAAIQSLRRIRAEMRRREMILPLVPRGLDLGEEPGLAAAETGVGGRYPDVENPGTRVKSDDPSPEQAAATRAEVMYLTVAEAASALRVPKDAVDQLIKAGDLPAVRTAGRHVRIPAQAVFDRKSMTRARDAGAAPGGREDS